MEPQTKNCQNCKNDFIIESEDFNFYQKIKVPPPTFCPECRMIRRMCFRNERTLYHDTCKATGQKIISMFDPSKKLVVYNRDYWWSDKWDTLESGVDYDFSKPFFEQFDELLKVAPLANLGNTNVAYSDYVNHTADSKNCYLTYASWKSENVFYSQGAVETRDSYDLYTTVNLDNCYEDVICAGSYKTHFSYDSDNSIDSFFLDNCVGCQDCFACINLHHKKYHIYNQPYSKEEYHKKINELDLGSYTNLQKIKKQYKDFSLTQPHRFASILKSSQVTGDYMMTTKNSKMMFDVYGDIQDSAYSAHAVSMRDCYDGYGFGANSELLYEGVDSGISAARQFFAILTHTSFDTQYTYMCYNSKHLFGCIGLRSKEYCILNKQYSKEEYEKLVPRIIDHMNEMPYKDSNGCIYKYGEFFPVEISPFAYNETIAQEYFSLSKDEALKSGYFWKSKDERNYNITIKADQIPDHIKEVENSILNEIIECANKGKEETKCTEAFKILPDELTFYKKMNFPLPRLCPNCRHFERLSQRRPLKLWHRKCMKYGCTNEFETSYAPERPEIIYCEKCYQQEVL